MKLKLLSRIASTLIVLSMYSCMKIKSKGDGAEEAPAVQATSADQKIDASFLSTSPNTYQVKFEFHEAPESIYVTKTILGVKNSEWIKLSHQIWIDEKVKAGDEINYEFRSNNQGHIIPFDEIDLKIPKDLVVDRAMDFSQKEFSQLFTENQNGLVLKQFAKIYLTAQGSITLDGRSLQIEAQEIHSEDGLIRSFAPGAKAADGKTGRSGGVIEIKTAKATGHLRVEMRGENGGDGIPAAAPDAKLKGAQGAAGEPGTPGGQIGDGGMFARASCAKKPTRGLPGDKGHQGNPGGNGQRGGASGHLSVEISKDEGFTLLATTEVGQGGVGASGGEGGEGGDGGPAGALPYSRGLLMYECDQFPGPKGAKGDLGTTGQAGALGDLQSVCESKNQQPPVCSH